MPGDYPYDDDYSHMNLLAHHWVVLEDKVIDPTADQFNDYLNEPMPDVYVGPNIARYVDDPPTLPAPERADDLGDPNGAGFASERT